eukprot:TRINITY_DN7930_c0_g1_i1.p1 TRINITY_DN7930_c0_g1~~TRINITY_DN7930_c0_g1_i1.p1  ORF type:complete len:552 (-),score=66.99 TRINITY_DN7930_c0_g1_i1:28-1683(-)
MFDVINPALARVISELRLNVSHCNNISSLRAFVIMLENPTLLDDKSELLGPLLHVIFLLTPESQKLIFSYWDKEPNAFLLRWLKELQEYIEKRIERQFNFSPHKDTSLTAATKTIGYIYDLNHRRKFVDNNSFYNAALNNLLMNYLDDDFYNWEKLVPGGFSYCDYPFMLNSETKSEILKCENEMEQSKHQDMSILSWSHSAYLICNVNRSNLIDESLTQLSNHHPEDLKKPLKIRFSGEEGVDEGGVQKEWFQLITRELFDPKYGMFDQIEDTRCHWFSSTSRDFREYELIGIVIGLAIYNSVILDLHFPLLIYKKLLGETPTLEDLVQINPALYKGLKQLLEFDGDVENTFFLSFQITYSTNLLAVNHYDLLPNGREISVTNKNKQEYVDKYVQYLLVDQIQEQFAHFYKGFKLVCNSKAFRLFNAHELELAICGSPVLDFKALERITKYDGYSADHPTIKHFWEVVHDVMDLEQKKKLLFFSTGSDRSPIGGLEKLNFLISKVPGDTDRLPSAQTCFNCLLLPEYQTKEKLTERLLKAVNNAEGFGLH